MDAGTVGGYTVLGGVGMGATALGLTLRGGHHNRVAQGFVNEAGALINAGAPAATGEASRVLAEATASMTRAKPLFAGSSVLLKTGVTAAALGVVMIGVDWLRPDK